MPLTDEDGRDIPGLFGFSDKENLLDDYDRSVAWRSSTDHHEDNFTGEATIDRELWQKEFNRDMEAWMI